MLKLHEVQISVLKSSAGTRPAPFMLLLFSRMAELSKLQKRLKWPMKPKMCIVWPLTEVCRCLSCVTKVSPLKNVKMTSPKGIVTHQEQRIRPFLAGGGISGNVTRLPLPAAAYPQDGGTTAAHVCAEMHRCRRFATAPRRRTCLNAWPLACIWELGWGGAPDSRTDKWCHASSFTNWFMLDSAFRESGKLTGGAGKERSNAALR